ncbi:MULTISPECIES: tRNA (N6-isopentenyl adenosine(37)-C2)-methylthiotransferase MiaB [Methylobacillus]|uniref:tRNA-2-methylthio-N(6)-dimethylallyladenosine synthase n=1 Tax=Methylobacillus flagellatus (strain ATCC 51484 / DSM 6875 / VKM B-1610 / KT) TaxID=265072 RepID=MIAB_METFK|nr:MULTISPECIES: tRNA (N6-isopentenyl adenosine(37)-C2)-methylthiotransferase MiaB [Methylobacillus]Q1H3L6.1 RecName: Full=tRNA-2-methylthio-N(6)-dimethylallyladenosine synthase; AltName: Full=(Dimethylallyl)adenosine tRNA methylthiotransferase MiaB; AltName: Full=tRNA-i(6)A37 methylthiotransferase [Methylobacillus flagellatus KT]ABE48921.1 tRNA-i(6)A37 thiotransferase enzyme MiaB [Methylobacillus flagellatus KT]MPS49550.1 tRNA (N6-isopentenyl adenosine(37)-C2)-methylthiotransferase MiaB [Methyl
MNLPKRIFIKTFGCQMNEYDSSRMLDMLQAAEGMQTTDNPEEADVILLNTCSVREKAQEKVFSHLGRFAPLKEKNPDLVIGVGGCVASQEGESIVARAPYVDVVFGPQTLHRLPDMIESKRRTGISQVDISFPEVEKFDHLPPPRVEGAAAFLSIMEGCSKYCTFCVVPYTRGDEVSRPFDDILTEAIQLAEQGVKEITLLGQNVNGYRSETADGEMADLALLIEYLAEIPEIERIRYTTSHPNEMTPALIDCYARIPKLVSHLHLPVQAGSDRVLMNMKRNYTVLQYKSIIRKLRAARPDICISSDFIVGFPGETEQDFEATMKLMRDVGFDFSFSFIYSPRPGTPASYLPDDCSPEEKQSRLSRLQALNEAQGKAISASMVGSIQRVLIESVSAKRADELAGRTDNNRIVNFPGDTALINQFVNVRITEALSHTLRGELV